jgi:hypothetical protein
MAIELILGGQKKEGGLKNGIESDLLGSSLVLHCNHMLTLTVTT